jgi:muramoyltetrapeptide carboxypeptidase
MRATRREFVRSSAAGLGLALPGLSLPGLRAEGESLTPIKPPRLAPGDTVGIINPVCSSLRPFDLDAVERAMSALGLRIKRSPASETERSDQARADELHGFFADPDVQAILPVRGGWGCARLLRRLDYELIRSHPKVLMGFSDVAALLLGIHAKTGLVTFHGPMGISQWVPFTVRQMRRVLFDGEAATLRNPPGASGDPDEQARTLVPGLARGRLLGGNLTVVSSLVGSPYLPPEDDLILFLEEVREPLSEVARMLTQLELAGILDRIRGFVFGQCTRCGAPVGDTQLTLDHVLAEHVERLGVPAWRGAPIGHVDRQFTLPIGTRVEIDATEGSIRLLEPAVS